MSSRPGGIRWSCRTSSPPGRVQPAFNQVNEARQERERTINEAQKRVNQELPRAQGAALRLVAEAEGYATERELRRIRAEATRTAEETRGRADAEATRIYGESFGEHPKFYAFFRTLESYDALGKNTTLLLRADSDFFRYIERPGLPASAP